MRWLAILATLTFLFCETEVRLGQPDPASLGGSTSTGGDAPSPATGAGPGSAGAPGTCSLRSSGPLVVSNPGQVVENLHVVARGEPAIVVEANGVTLRNLRVDHAEGPGIVVEGAGDVVIESVSVLNTGAPESGALASTEWDNVHCLNSPRLTMNRVRLEKGSSGAFLDNCPSATLSFIEGHDFRGPSFRGQFVRFDFSDDGVLEDFSVINPDTAWTENNVHVAESTNVTVARGLIDGNDAPRGHGVLFSGTRGQGLVEDVDAVRMGNGCFSAYTGADGSVFRRTRCRENICTDQGRGEPTSGGILWSGDENQSQLVVEDSVYFDACVTDVVWPPAAFAVLDLREEDFDLRPALNLRFCFE